MAGLLNQQQADQQAPQQQGGISQEEADRLDAEKIPKGQTPKDMADAQASAVPPNLQEGFSRVVQAGMKVMFSEETHSTMMEYINKEGDLGKNVGDGMAALMVLLYNKSNAKMPLELLIPAGSYLLWQGMDFIEKVSGEKMTPDIMATAFDEMVTVIMQKFGLDKNKVTAGLEQATQMRQGAQA